VSADELLHLRAEMAAGRGDVAIDDGKFSLAEYQEFLTDNDAGIAGFRQQQAIAFAAERRAWDLAGEFRRAS
jgi:urea carboxylase